MVYTLPNILTLVRMIIIPILVLVYFLPVPWSHLVTTGLFILAGLTDWLDGYLARRLGQYSTFGEFLDPVADKLMVTTVLVLLVADPEVQSAVISSILFTTVAVVIVGREIAVSALREWMAELGKRASVAVSIIGKLKTFAQIVSIALLLYRFPIAGVSAAKVGEILFYVAGALTIWSMFVYLRAAWPSLTEQVDSPQQ
ncbi:MAG: CDP-diacylglycerol--glycerol-3-phosphate 3-phosphatidyltransferase [Arenicellales bacterium]|nr:CDP-diacylglycerol--glycerol-3-phosphate 3-phosphatidyltransferase [Arenicellales bacterium]